MKNPAEGKRENIVAKLGTTVPIEYVARDSVNADYETQKGVAHCR
jgi:hypothetical protein